ncbi:hypothetical protein HX854_07285, partial [Marine Group I thaumarchaeote]|nr:hypothetical protein [Marine Group I thaumarchaeote]
MTSGGDIGGNHWAFGKKLIGKNITFGVNNENEKELIDLDVTEDVFIKARKQLGFPLRNINIPHRGKKFIRLRAERDINQEQVGENYDITDLIKHMGTRAALYGNASAGCLHVRPLVKLKSQNRIKIMA